MLLVSCKVNGEEKSFDDILIAGAASYAIRDGDTEIAMYSLPDFTVSPSLPDIPARVENMTSLNYVTLSFIGDCMLASYRGEDWWNTFNSFANEVEPEYFFAEVADIFKNDDFTIANCENVFTDDNSLYESRKSGNPVYWYKSPKKNAEIFTAGGVDIISVANNHTYDYGEQGYLDTIAAAEAAGLLWGDNNNIAYAQKDGFRIAFLFVTITERGNIDSLRPMIDEAEEKADYTIVYFHGGTEHVYRPSANIVRMAHDMVDAGCDLVIGSHPHVLQPIEYYNGATIVYSLGNFIFGAGRGENRTIIYQYTIYFSDTQVLKTEENVIPCYCFVERWQPAVIEDYDIRKRVLDFMQSLLPTPL